MSVHEWLKSNHSISTKFSSLWSADLAADQDTLILPSHLASSCCSFCAEKKIIHFRSAFYMVFHVSMHAQKSAEVLRKILLCHESNWQWKTVVPLLPHAQIISQSLVLLQLIQKHLRLWVLTILTVPDQQLKKYISCTSFPPHIHVYRISNINVFSACRYNQEEGKGEAGKREEKTVGISLVPAKTRPFRR